MEEKPVSRAEQQKQLRSNRITVRTSHCSHFLLCNQISHILNIRGRIMLYVLPLYERGHFVQATHLLGVFPWTITNCAGQLWMKSIFTNSMGLFFQLIFGSVRKCSLGFAPHYHHNNNFTTRNDYIIYLVISEMIGHHMICSLKCLRLI